MGERLKGERNRGRDALLEALRDGRSVAESCRRAGVSRSRAYAWSQDDGELADALAAVRASNPQGRRTDLAPEVAPTPRPGAPPREVAPSVLEPNHDPAPSSPTPLNGPGVDAAGPEDVPPAPPPLAPSAAETTVAQVEEGLTDREAKRMHKGAVHLLTRIATVGTFPAAKGKEPEVVPPELRLRALLALTQTLDGHINREGRTLALRALPSADRGKPLKVLDPFDPAEQARANERLAM